MYLTMKQNWVFFPLKFNFYCSHLNTKELLNICIIMGWVCYLCLFIEWIKLPVLTFRLYFYFSTMIFSIYWAPVCQAWVSTHLIYSLEEPLGVSYCYFHLWWNWVYSKAMNLTSVQKHDAGMKKWSFLFSVGQLWGKGKYWWHVSYYLPKSWRDSSFVYLLP